MPIMLQTNGRLQEWLEKVSLHASAKAKFPS